MKKIVLLVCLFIAANNYAQSLSETRIIYEHKDQIVMNNGEQCKILVDTPFYLVSDSTIERYKQVTTDHVFRLNRVLIISSNNGYIELIEWVKDDMTFYKSKELGYYTLKQNNISNYFHSIGK